MRNTHTHQKHPKLQSAIGVNLREDLENEYFASQAVADDPYKRSLLTASELQYLIQNGNTATLFIHGYNVDYGEFSVMHLDGIDGSGQARSLNVEMPIYRDELLIDDWACYNADHTPANPWVSAAYERICERYSHVKHDIQSDFSSMRKNTFNGTGTHQWWLHMEDNLNRAAGHEPAGDYENYTRIVNVMWQGNPKNPADYMAAVSMAERAGGLLIPLLEQLINKGLRVNIIAHSLGNLVLAKALDILGEVPVYHQAIDQAVFWEPAMPDTVFTPGEKDESIFSRYQCPLALKVLKRSTILFSEHDNVLGPVPAEKHLSEKWQQGGWPYVLIAEAVNWIDEHHFGNDIKSLYNIANMLGVPMHYLLGHANHREAFYQSWIAQHPRTLGGVSFSRSLDDQIAYFSRHYLLPFRGLSLVCGMLLHGVHQPVKDLKQFRSLAEMAMNGDLSPLAFVKNGFTQENGRLSWRDQSVEETAAIILTVLLSPEAQPRAAMGWRGPDFLSKAVSCPVNLCDQSDWLFSHSGMLRPNTDLLLSVYRGWVIGQHGIQQFGRYPVADLQPESVEDSDPSPFTDSRLTIPEKIAV